MRVSRPLRGVRVLVVDDDADARTVLRQMMEWFGATVHTVRGGREALAWLNRRQQRTPDLLLLDLRMPEMDGVTVLLRLRARARFRKLRAIAVTAYGSHQDVMRTWEAGFDGHLVKPIDLETLAAAVKRAFWGQFTTSHAPTRARRPPRVRVPAIAGPTRRRASRLPGVNRPR